MQPHVYTGGTKRMQRLVTPCRHNYRHGYPNSKGCKELFESAYPKRSTTSLSTSNQVLLEALQDMQNEHGLRFPNGTRPIMTMSEHFTPRLSIGYLSFKESALNSPFVDLPVNHISMCPVVKQPHQKAPSLGPTG
jgi:hypothetical protein